MAKKLCIKCQRTIYYKHNGKRYCSECLRVKRNKGLRARYQRDKAYRKRLQTLNLEAWRYNHDPDKIVEESIKEVIALEVAERKKLTPCQLVQLAVMKGKHDPESLFH
jgi:hypothetical protein